MNKTGYPTYGSMYCELLVKKFDAHLLYSQVAEMSEESEARQNIAGYLRFIQDELDIFMIPELFNHANSIYVSRASLGQLHKQQLEKLVQQMQRAVREIKRLLMADALVENGIRLRVTEDDLPLMAEKDRIALETVQSLKHFPDFLRLVDTYCQKYGVTNRYSMVIHPYTDTNVVVQAPQNNLSTVLDLHCTIADVALLFKSLKTLGVTQATDTELASMVTINGKPITAKQLRQAKTDVRRQSVTISETMRSVMSDFIIHYLRTLELYNENDLTQLLQTLKKLLQGKYR